MAVICEAHNSSSRYRFVFTTLRMIRDTMQVSSAPTADGEFAIRPESRDGEEFANCASHVLAFVLTVVVAPFAIDHLAHVSDGGARLTGFVVFAVTMALMYLSSSIFHGLPAGRRKSRFELLDRSAIYLFIAGSYSLFAIPTLGHRSTWLVFGGVWLVAAVGVIITVMDLIKRPQWIAVPYLVLGWLAIGGVATQTGPLGDLNLMMLVCGGAAYTVGALLYVLSTTLRFGHLVWHVLVVAGSSLHLAAGLA